MAEQLCQGRRRHSFQPASLAQQRLEVLLQGTVLVLDQGKIIILDGATGTELNRRGVDTGLPMWSANALTNDTGLNVLRRIHMDYLNAGADILTANTFRTHRRALAGKGHAARELTWRAVVTAQEAVAEFGKPAQVAGSVAPRISRSTSRRRTSWCRGFP
jgi:S-methylmethionine-dependent homocysteine/selenocysteine methylase